MVHDDRFVLFQGICHHSSQGAGEKTRRRHLCTTPDDDDDDVFGVAVFETSDYKKKPLLLKCQKR